MAVSITPKGNLLFSGPMTPYEESLFSARVNAGPKTIARSANAPWRGQRCSSSKFACSGRLRNA